LRYTKNNWNKYFDGSGKKTTIRLTQHKIGNHKCWAGSYYKPELLGTHDVVKIAPSKFGELTEVDAKNDGFKNIEELKEELKRLNPNINPKNDVYIHWTDNVKRA